LLHGLQPSQRPPVAEEIRHTWKRGQPDSVPGVVHAVPDAPGRSRSGSSEEPPLDDDEEEDDDDDDDEEEEEEELDGGGGGGGLLAGGFGAGGVVAAGSLGVVSLP
jgi:hypothetical protein